MTGCLRSDLRLHGVDITGTPESFSRLVQYVTQTHNHFGVGGSVGQSAGLENRRTPLELVLNKDRSKPVSTMFGSVCHAQVPDSLIELIPEKTRFIPAAYMHVKPNSLARVVSSCTQGSEKVYQAEIKPLTEILQDCSLAPSILTEVSKPDLPPSLEDPEKAVRPLDDKVGPGRG